VETVEKRTTKKSTNGWHTDCAPFTSRLLSAGDR
jgi:hypothetical protein